MSYLCPPLLVIILRWTITVQARLGGDPQTLQPCETSSPNHLVLKSRITVGEEAGKVTATINGKPAETYRLEPDDSESLFTVNETSGVISVTRPDGLLKKTQPYNLSVIASTGDHFCSIQIHVSFWQKERTFYIPPAASQLRSTNDLDIGSTSSQLVDNSDVIPYPTAPPSSEPAKSLELLVYSDTSSQSASPFPFHVSYVTFPHYTVLPATTTSQTPISDELPPRQIILQPRPSGSSAQSPDSVVLPIAFMPPGSPGYGNGQPTQTPTLPIAFMPPGSPGYGNGQPPGSGCSGVSCRQPPVCSQPLYTAIIPEAAIVGTPVLRAAAAGQGVQWTISDTAFERFSINPSTGEISVIGNLRRRTRAALEFKIRATDIFGLWCDSIVRINIVDNTPDVGPGRNGNSNSQPFFVQDYYYFAIQCGAGPQRVGSVLASDMDRTQVITYQVINTSEFSIDSRGNIQTTGTIQSAADRTFYVTATDSGTPPQVATATVTITVSGSCTPQNSNSNSAPVFGQSQYLLSASCRVNNVFVGMTTATDFERNTVIYSTRGTQEFTINPNTGEVRSQGVLTDSQPRTFTVIATDNGQPPLSSTVTVTVNVVNCQPPNNPPAFGQSAYQFSLQCNSGTFVGNTQAFDTDGSTLTYSLSGTQEFTVNPSTGAISVSVPLQAPGIRQFSVVATDSGPSVMSVTAAVTVIITGTCQPPLPPAPPPVVQPTQPPPPPPPPIQFPTPPPPTLPPPPPPPIQFPTLPPPTLPPPPPPIQFPTLPPAPPILFPTPPPPVVFPTAPPPIPVAPTQPPPPPPPIIQLPTPPSPVPLPTQPPPPPIQFPTQPTLPFPVTPLPSSPVFSSSSYFFVVPCTSGRLTEIGNIQATDPKSTRITYSVISGSPGFDVDYQTGVLVTLGAFTFADLGQKTIVVAASDSYIPRTTATASVSIIVVGPCAQPATLPPPTFPNPPTFPPLPVTQVPPVTQAPYFPPPQTFPPIIATTNAPLPTYTIPLTFPPTSASTTQAPPLPQPPRFSQTDYTFLMTCQLNTNQLVGVVQATSPQGQAIIYSLSGTRDFIIAPTTGEIRLIRLLSGPQVVTFQATATDTLGGQATVQVSVSVPACPPPVNRPPQFPQSSYSFTIPCPTSPNILIGLISAQFAQQGVVYTLVNTNQFSVDNAGEIRSTVLLGSGQSYSFTITATDSRNPQLSASALVTISVGPCPTQPPPTAVTLPTYPPVTPPSQVLVPNIPPYFTLPAYTFSVACSSQPGTLIGSVYAFGDRATVAYSIQSISQNFAINPVTGDIRTTTQLTSGSPIAFTVVASDSKGLTASASVTVSVYGCAPTIATQPGGYRSLVIGGPLSATYTNCDQVSGPVERGTVVGTITASSSDGNAQLQYSTIGADRFTVSPSSGQIAANTALDTGSYFIVISVTDSITNPVGSATATFTVTVDCSSSGSRPCNPPYIETAVSESAPVGTSIISISSPGTGLSVSHSRPYYLGQGGSSGLLPIDGSPASFASSSQLYSSRVRRTDRWSVRRESPVQQVTLNASELFPKKYRQLTAPTNTRQLASSTRTTYAIQKESSPGVFRIDQTT